MPTPEITQPKVAIIAPGIPAICKPTNVEVFSANGPGVICEIVIISVKIRCDTHEYFSTTSCRMNGMIAYPPPILN